MLQPFYASRRTSDFNDDHFRPAESAAEVRAYLLSPIAFTASAAPAPASPPQPEAVPPAVALNTYGEVVISP